MTKYEDNVVGTWTCNCGKDNTGMFCVKCGTPRPVVPAQQKPVSNGKGETSVFSTAQWVCTCGKSNMGNFCVKCGALRPAQEAVARKAAEEIAARKTVETQAAQKTATGKTAEEIATQEVVTHKTAGEATAHQAVEAQAAQETAVRKAAEAQTTSISLTKADDNKGLLKKVAIGVAVLLLLIGAYFMFIRKKETPPAPEPTKTETKAETKTDAKKPADLATKEEKPMDPAAREAKLKEYAEMVKVANAEKKQDATTNGKIVFLVDDVKRNGNDLVVSGHFYNGKKNRRITSVKSIQLDILLRDMDKELLNEKNIKYEKAFIGISIDPLQDSLPVSLDLPGKAPASEFNNYVVTVHDVHWEGVGY